MKLYDNIMFYYIIHPRNSRIYPRLCILIFLDPRNWL